MFRRYILSTFTESFALPVRVDKVARESLTSTVSGKKGATELYSIDPGRRLPAGNRDISPIVHRGTNDLVHLLYLRMLCTLWLFVILIAVGKISWTVILL